MRDACSGENRGEEDISAEEKDEERRAAASGNAMHSGKRSKRDRFIERGLWTERGHPLDSPSLFTF
jgi:hypothetical protein